MVGQCCNVYQLVDLNDYLRTIGSIEFISTENFKIKRNSSWRCCLEVKLAISKELHPKFRDYPMCPEQMKVPYNWYSIKQKV